MTQDPAALDFSDATARRAFGMLLRDARPLSATDLAAQLGSDESSVLDALRALGAAGRAEFDGEGRLIGIYGLTLKPTEHRLLIRNQAFFVWCAFDSVGIPAALGESASVTSACAHCGREVALTIVDGRPPSIRLVISWLQRRCDSVREEFCPTVNFYCDEEHYKASLSDGGAADSYLTLEAAASIGRANWGWAAERP